MTGFLLIGRKCLLKWRFLDKLAKLQKPNESFLNVELSQNMWEYSVISFSNVSDPFFQLIYFVNRNDVKDIKMICLRNEIQRKYLSGCILLQARLYAAWY